jgi:hypothetical protein
MTILGFTGWMRRSGRGCVYGLARPIELSSYLKQIFLRLVRYLLPESDTSVQVKMEDRCELGSPTGWAHSLERRPAQQLLSNTALTENKEREHNGLRVKHAKGVPL